jgi:hypothetical protein
MKKLYILLILLFSLLHTHSQNQKPNVYRGTSISRIHDNVEFHDLNELFEYDTSKASKRITTNWIQEKLNSYIKNEYTELTNNPAYISNDLLSNKINSEKVKIYSKKIFFLDNNLITHLTQ